MRNNYSFERIKKVKPSSFFAFTATLFGLLFLFITPPFQGPDEINHFYKAYQIADGHFTSEIKDDRLGGHIPKSIIKSTGAFTRLR